MKIRVLQVFASLDMGGAECRMMDVYRSIDREQIQFDFVTLLQGEQFFEQEIESFGGKVIKLQSPREIGIKNHIQALRKCMREGKYQAVHAHTSYHCGIVMYAAKKEGIPVRITHARTNGSIQNSIKTKVYITFGRGLINHYSTNKLAISEDSGKFVFGNKNFEVVPNSIDLSKYQCVNQNDINNLRKELYIKENEVVIGHVGRFDRFKNQRFVIDVFSDYLKDNADAKLILIGDGDLKNELEQYAQQLHISDKIVFTGIRDDIPILMNLFDVLLFPSIIEGLGGVVLEAQAAGTPAVISENVPETVDVGLGLITRCSLETNKSIWVKKIQDSLAISIPEFSKIKKRFDQSGYSLNTSAKRYIDIYKGKTVDE